MANVAPNRTLRRVPEEPPAAVRGNDLPSERAYAAAVGRDRARRLAAIGVLVLAPIIVVVLLSIAGAQIRPCMGLDACREAELVSEPIVYYGALVGAGAVGLGWLVTLVPAIAWLMAGRREHTPVT